MTGSPVKKDDPGASYSNLPLKITGIVFWGLVLVGLVASTAFISFLESQLTTERELKLDLTHDTLEQLVQTLGNDSADNLRPALELLQARFGFNAIEVQYKDELIRVGDPQPGMDISDRSFQSSTLLKSGNKIQQRVGVKISLPPLKEQVSSLRKNILIIIAAIFLGFGFFLHMMEILEIHYVKKLAI